MADNNITNQLLQAIANSGRAADSSVEALLARIESSVSQIASSSMSQTNARRAQDDKHFQDNYKNGSYKDIKNKANKSAKSFSDAFEDALIDGFLGSGFKNQVKGIFQGFAGQLGVSVKDIPGTVGKLLGNQISANFGKSFLGRRTMRQIDNLKNTSLSVLQTKGQSAVSGLMNPEQSGGLFKAIGSAAGPIMQILKAAAPLLIKLKLLSIGLSALTEIVSAASGFFNIFSKNLNKNIELQKKFREFSQQRLKDDVKSMIEEPFNILKEAAQAVYAAWDNNLKIITATQGYDKAGLQDLMSLYTARLQQEGLSSYISGDTLVNNLTNVLKSGLSGKVAEEFSYVATKLGAAIPTQDFFNFASTYASVAANAIRSGQSEAQAIQYADETLQQFASSLLYASRELSGGFTTGLQDASSLYEQAVKIAQAGRTTNISEIASVLLAVRGELGAVAPDLASSITDTIYRLLTGGNASDIVALRSLAGINASNTEFLRAVAKNPKEIFSTLFRNLSNMYMQSSDAYMEKAEGYSELFGISSEAFQRVNFADLANAISRMNVNMDSLDENMNLMLSGQTTSTKEQLKNQEINRYMLEEGLSLVLDNEVGRSIQEHMWNEQLAREIEEATYAVDLQGQAFEILDRIRAAVEKVKNILNPLKWGKAIFSTIDLAGGQEAEMEYAKIATMLQLTKVGSPGSESTQLYNLTHINKDLNLVSDIITMLGGSFDSSKYSTWEGKFGNPTWSSLFGDLGSGVAESLLARRGGFMGRMSTTQDQLDVAGSLIDSVVSFVKDASDMASSVRDTAFTTGITSKYSWGSVGKSTARLSSYLLGRGTELGAPMLRSNAVTGSASASASALQTSINKMLEDSYLYNEYVKQGKGYEEWAASASRFGISDLSAALESIGSSESSIREYFENKEVQAGGEQKLETAQHEKLFRDTGISFWNERFFNEYRDPLSSQITDFHSMVNDNFISVIDKIEDFHKSYDNWIQKHWVEGFMKSGFSGNVSGVFSKLYTEFMKYFVEHKYYSSTTGYTYADVQEIQDKARKQESGDTVTALAEMLTSNLLNLEDPAMQTNALLAQILIVIQAMQAQQNDLSTSKGSTIIDSLSAMSLGLSTVV